MTPQEALAEGLRAIAVPTSHEEWQQRVDASYEDDAATIIEALPEGWVVGMEGVTWQGHGPDYYLAIGAQQERERLRMQWAAWLHEEFGTPSFERLESYIDAILADPDA